MRILQVTGPTWFFVSHRLPLARAARDAGHELHLAAAPDATVSLVEEEGIRFHPIQFSRSGTNPAAELRTIGQLCRLYRQLRPDLVYHLSTKAVIYGSAAARITRVPAIVNSLPGLGYVFTGRNGRTSPLRPLVRQLFRFALGQPNQILLVENHDDRDFFVEGGFVAKNRVIVSRGSGVDPEEFSAVVRPPRLPTVLLAARMLWDKGVGEFVQAAEQLRSAGVGARFVLVGGTDSDNPTAIPEGTLREWHRSGVVEWWEHRTDMPEVFAQADIICLPSYYREGLPKVLLEAAASGLPLVGADAPGCREIVRHGSNGLLVSPGDSLALAEAIRTLVQDADMRVRFGARGREIVLEEFTTDRAAEELLGVFERFSSPHPRRESWSYSVAPAE